MPELLDSPRPVEPEAEPVSTGVSNRAISLALGACLVAWAVVVYEIARTLL